MVHSMNRLIELWQANMFRSLWEDWDFRKSASRIMCPSDFIILAKQAFFLIIKMS